MRRSPCIHGHPSIAFASTSAKSPVASDIVSGPAPLVKFDHVPVTYLGPVPVTYLGPLGHRVTGSPSVGARSPIAPLLPPARPFPTPYRRPPRGHARPGQHRPAESTLTGACAVAAGRPHTDRERRPIRTLACSLSEHGPAIRDTISCMRTPPSQAPDLASFAHLTLSRWRKNRVLRRPSGSPVPQGRRGRTSAIATMDGMSARGGSDTEQRRSRTALPARAAATVRRTVKNRDTTMRYTSFACRGIVVRPTCQSVRLGHR
jgi:hypothetical protein